jgi:hypothetical protein
VRIVALAALFLVVAGCGGSTTGSGHVVTTSRAVSRFSSIDLTGAATIWIAVGRTTSLTIAGDDNVVPLIRTEVRDGVLVISSKHGYSTNHRLDVVVATPTLTGFALRGAGTVTASGIRAPAFSLDLEGAGTVALKGIVGKLDASISGSGSALLGNLVAKDAHVTLSGTGSTHVHVTGTLDATVSGVGTILYSGHPAHVQARVSGVGSITES